MEEDRGTDEQLKTNSEGERAEVVAHFDPAPTGDGLDGNTPLEAGIQGRLTEAGGHKESPRIDYDWQPEVEVDQPVQQVRE